jgi:hypothetical protein
MGRTRASRADWYAAMTSSNDLLPEKDSCSEVAQRSASWNASVIPWAVMKSRV